MTTNKPEVLGYLIRVSGQNILIDHTNNPDGLDKLIRLSDYETLQAECEQQYDMKVKAREQRDAVTTKLNALQAECETLRKDAERYVPLNEAVQRAAAELPEGWEIQMCVMRDSGWVDLIGPDGTEDFDTNNERLDYTVIDALEAAIQGSNP